MMTWEHPSSSGRRLVENLTLLSCIVRAVLQPPGADCGACFLFPSLPPARAAPRCAPRVTPQRSPAEARSGGDGQTRLQEGPQGWMGGVFSMMALLKYVFFLRYASHMQTIEGVFFLPTSWCVSWTSWWRSLRKCVLCLLACVTVVNCGQ